MLIEHESLTICLGFHFSICQLAGKYHEGDLDPKSAWLYLAIVNNISQIVSENGLDPKST